ncbi:putative sporulation transcription regulator WhiA [Arthrobacter sp. Hiyo4]|nr:putative sporulation transcription regulator WhiA [Arthrobacter sp. Hiyo4]
MALTSSVKEELSRLDIKKSSVRKAEVSAMLRFAGGLHIISGRIVIEAEVDLASTARRLRAAIAEVYGHQSEIIVVSGGGLRRGSRYVVRVVRDGESLARQTGLLDGRGRPVRGFPRPWSTARPPTPRLCGVVRSWHTGRSRNRAVRHRWRLPARAPSPRLPSLVPPAVLASRLKPAKSGEWTGW